MGFRVYRLRRDWGINAYELLMLWVSVFGGVSGLWLRDARRGGGALNLQMSGTMDPALLNSTPLSPFRLSLSYILNPEL